MFLNVHISALNTQWHIHALNIMDTVAFIKKTFLKIIFDKFEFILTLKF